MARGNCAHTATQVATLGLVVACLLHASSAQLSYHTDSNSNSFTLKTPALQQSFSRVFGGQQQQQQRQQASPVAQQLQQFGQPLSQPQLQQQQQYVQPQQQQFGQPQQQQYAQPQQYSPAQLSPLVQREPNLVNTNSGIYFSSERQKWSRTEKYYERILS
uniref:Uncharacterized protein n=1 Tax=Bactrocera latifrons TaxID=174628 RepID=A0A0K8U8K6_BACLA